MNEIAKTRIHFILIISHITWEGGDPQSVTGVGVGKHIVISHAK